MPEEKLVPVPGPPGPRGPRGRPGADGAQGPPGSGSTPVVAFDGVSFTSIADTDGLVAVGAPVTHVSVGTRVLLAFFARIIADVGVCQAKAVLYRDGVAVAPNLFSLPLAAASGEYATMGAVVPVPSTAASHVWSVKLQNLGTGASMTVADVALSVMDAVYTS